MPRTSKWQKTGRRLARGMKRVRKRLYRRLRGQYVHLLILVACTTIVITAFVLPPDQIVAQQLGFRWNVYRFLDNFFGLKCASCTLARSFSACAQGQLSQAFKHDGLGPLIFLYLALQIPYRLWSLARYPKRIARPALRFQAGYTALVVALIVVDWLLTYGKRVI